MENILCWNSNLSFGWFSDAVLINAAVPNNGASFAGDFMI